jgi:predicted ATP-grasp superfamily ATP-dependent carboligase
LHILLYEHISSGGLAGEDLPASILSEGFAMLNTATADFQAAGHDVTVLLDSRLAIYGAALKTKNMLAASTKEDAKKTLLKTSKEANATLVIAPESDQVLSSIVTQLEYNNVQSLNCSPKAIEKVSNKANLQTYAASLGLPVPETLLLSSTATTQEITAAITRHLQFPVILKPTDGTSCSGLSVIDSPSQISTAVNKIKKFSADKQFIAQQFVEGVAVSVSVISNGHQALPISLNRQSLVLKAPEADSAYSGGEVPFESTIKEAAYSVAKKVVESTDGLNGYIGVDLVLTADTAFILDLNPRLTTSYVGLSKVACFNIAQAIVDAVVNGKLPEAPTLSGYSCFSKITLPKPPLSALPLIYKMPGVISPPFPLQGEKQACALLEAHGITVFQAHRNLQEAKEQLIHACKGDL